MANVNTHISNNNNNDINDNIDEDESDLVNLAPPNTEAIPLFVGATPYAAVPPMDCLASETAEQCMARKTYELQQSDVARQEYWR
jgi:hypothetical protein